jgi:hypothetical protein
LRHEQLGAVSKLMPVGLVERKHLADFLGVVLHLLKVLLGALML